MDLKNLDIPRRPFSDVQKSENNTFLKFVPSGLENDVGQNTLPFIDIQEIVTNPPVPMSGAGLYHKRTVDSGGFIALKLFTFDVRHHLQANLIDILNSTSNEVQSKKHKTSFFEELKHQREAVKIVKMQSFTPIHTSALSQNSPWKYIILGVFMLFGTLCGCLYVLHKRNFELRYEPLN